MCVCVVSKTHILTNNYVYFDNLYTECVCESMYLFDWSVLFKLSPKFRFGSVVVLCVCVRVCVREREREREIVYRCYKRNSRCKLTVLPIKSVLKGSPSAFSSTFGSPTHTHIHIHTCTYIHAHMWRTLYIVTVTNGFVCTLYYHTNIHC